MMSLSKAGAAAAALILMVQPSLAAASTSNFGTGETRTAAFAGVQVRMPLGQKERAKPVARLQLSSAYYTRQRSGAFVQTHRTTGLELGIGNGSKPAVYIQGRDAAEVKQQLNLSGTTTTLLIVGGVVLVVVILAAVAGATPTAGPNEGAFD
jgi:hypothetical protein